MTFIYDMNQKIAEFSELVSEYEKTASKLKGLADWSGVDSIDDVFDTYRQIEGVIQQGNAFAHSTANTDQWFRDNYDTYDAYYNEIANRGFIDEQPVMDRIDGWTETHRSTIMNVLKAHGIHADQVDTAEQRLSLLQDQSRTAEGRMQALQVGQEIAAEEIKQLHGLKEIMMEQSDLQSSYLSFKVSLDSEKRAHGEWIRRQVGNGTIIGNEVGAILP